MQFLINVLPNNKFTQNNVKQFISNIESQHYPNVTLIFKKDRSLTTSIINYIKSTDISTIIIKKYSDVRLNNNQHNYWLNLHVTDCLLPNAFTQWEQIINRHFSNVIELTYLYNEQPLAYQTNQIISKINEKHPVRLDTVKSMLNLPVNIPLFNLSLSSQLLILLGLQNYKVMDSIHRYKQLNNSYLGYNFLILSTSDMISEFDKRGITNTLINIIINSLEIVKINLPTIILSQFSLENRIKWLSEISNAANYIGDENLLNSYKEFIKKENKEIKKEIFLSKKSRFVKHYLMAKVNLIGKNLLETNKLD